MKNKDKTTTPWAHLLSWAISWMGLWLVVREVLGRGQFISVLVGLMFVALFVVIMILSYEYIKKKLDGGK